jgi:hypothetical protein
MRIVRLIAGGLAVAAFVAAGICPEGVPLPGLGLGPAIRLQPMTAFWLGVGLLLLAVWGQAT